MSDRGRGNFFGGAHAPTGELDGETSPRSRRPHREGDSVGAEGRPNAAHGRPNPAQGRPDPAQGRPPGESERPSFNSPDAALQFYFAWRPRLESARSVTPADVEQAEMCFVRGGRPVYEEVLALCADVAVCLDVLELEERRVVEACFGRVFGQSRAGHRDGEAVYVDQTGAALPLEIAQQPTSLAWSSKGSRKRTPNRGRPKESLSFSGVARMLGWNRAISVGPDNAPRMVPDHQRVAREYDKARRKLRGAMRRRGIIS